MLRTNEFVYYTRPSPPSFQRNRIRGNAADVDTWAYDVVIVLLQRYISSRGNLIIILHRGFLLFVVIRIKFGRVEKIGFCLFLFLLYSAFYFLIPFSIPSPSAYSLACVVHAKDCKLRRFRQLRPSPLPIPLLDSGPSPRDLIGRLLSFGTRSLNLVNDNRGRRPLICRLVHRLCLEL